MRDLPILWRDVDRPLASFGAWRPMLRQLDDFFNEVWDPQLSGTRGLVPACDISESEDRYLMSVDMPGMDPNDIEIQVRGNVLTVRGERKVDRSDGEGTNRFGERRYGSFERSITLPEGIQADAVEAQYDRGVLTLAIPKAEEARAHKIKIGESKSRFLGNGGSRKEKESVNVKAAKGETKAATH